MKLFFIWKKKKKETRKYLSIPGKKKCEKICWWCDCVTATAAESNNSSSKGWTDETTDSSFSWLPRAHLKRGEQMNRERKKCFTQQFFLPPHTHNPKKLPCDFNLLKRKDSPQGNSHKFDTLSISLWLFSLTISQNYNTNVHIQRRTSTHW